jgi:hypothetical protein
MLRSFFLIAHPPLLEEALLSKITLPIPRLSKAGMASRSEGWGGLFKDKQYRLIKERFASIYKVATRL